MTPNRDAYLAAASTVAPLVRDDAVAAAWHRPSALDEFTVRGLAGHLASQVLMVGAALKAVESELPPVSLTDHYAGVSWIDAPLDADFNVAIRDGGERAAAEGPEALAAAVEAAVDEQRHALPEVSPERRILVPSGQWTLLVDDFVVTRAMEIAVHSDDLAVSAGISAPPLSDDTLAPVLDLLTRLSVRRHGQRAVLAALTRRERAPQSIIAF